MTKAAIARAMKGTSDPVVLRELAPDEDALAVLADLRTKAPPGAVLYLRRASDQREDGKTAAIMGRVRVG
jgi:hypothetical protein